MENQAIYLIKFFPLELKENVNMPGPSLKKAQDRLTEGPSL